MSRPEFFKLTLPGGPPKGQTILWLHGWGQDHQSLLPLAGLFKSKFKTILFDLPGFGKTPMLEGEAGPEEYAEALIREIEKTLKEPVIIAGHSFGCRVAIRLAARRPDLVSALVLIAAAGLKRDRGPLFRIKSLWLKLLSRLAGVSDGLFKTNFKAAFSQKFGSRDYRNAGALRPTFVKTVNEDLTGHARKISCPVLLLFGSEDTETPPEFGERYQALIHGSDLKILQGIDHLGILTAGKHKCQHYMSGFLSGLD